MLGLRWDSNPQSHGFEATEHLRKRIRKENFEYVFKCIFKLETILNYRDLTVLIDVAFFFISWGKEFQIAAQE